ncbi:MAG: glycosyltransferase family 2 protein, partial [Bacteroidales bacterium]|nr:glycosyltransferase family 2 protein [Bacteroidales bacterium]
PQIRLIENDANYGFAEGYNRALRQVEADYYVLLNSDIEVSPHWVEPVIAMLEADPTAAAAQPKLRAYDRPTHFEYAGAAGGFIDRLGYPFCRGRLFDSVEEDRGQYDTPREIFWATGAALFVRAGLYRKFGGLDAAFFAHMEEIDFCWRLKNFGYKILYCPESTVYHVGGGTLPKSSPRKTFLNFRNNLCLLYKNLTPGRFRRVFCQRIALDFVAALSFLASGGPAECAAVFKAYGAFFKMRRQYRADYALLPRHAYVNDTYVGSIVADYHLRRIRRFDQLSLKKFYKEDPTASTPRR